MEAYRQPRNIVQVKEAASYELDNGFRMFGIAGTSPRSTLQRPM
jgi:hypothetical protein